MHDEGHWAIDVSKIHFLDAISFYFDWLSVELAAISLALTNWVQKQSDFQRIWFSVDFFFQENKKGGLVERLRITGKKYTCTLVYEFFFS